jgi:cytochrome b561
MGKCGDGAPAEAVYPRCARRLHWSTVALLGVQIPVGLFMVRYGVATDFAAPTGILYDGHKLLGLLILLLAAVRLAYRSARGALPSEPSLAAWQKTMSHVTHWAIYAMLFAVPLLGWLAISYYGPFRPFGLALPVLAAENGDRAQRFFALHRLAAYALIVLIGMHVGAALFHYLVRKDGVMRRMLPSAGLRA